MKLGRVAVILVIAVISAAIIGYFVGVSTVHLVGCKVIDYYVETTIQIGYNGTTPPRGGITTYTSTISTYNTTTPTINIAGYVTFTSSTSSHPPSAWWVTVCTYLQ